MVPVAGALPNQEQPNYLSPSAQAALDGALAELHAAKDIWAQMELAAKAAILARLHADLSQQQAAWMAVTLQAKGVAAGGFAEGEEWALLGGLLRLLRLLRKSLLEIEKYGHPLLPGKPQALANGQLRVPTFPTARLEQVILPGLSAETWLEPGVNLDNLFALPTSGAQAGAIPGRIALVLGAGNVGVLQCADLLHKLFVENQVVALKMNPVNAYLAPILERAFCALIEIGCLRILHGGAEAGAYLCDHPLVTTIHLTGSDKTFESIVFGPGEAGRQRKAAQQPRLAKPFTAELGCVNPVIVAPGAWSAKDITRAAEMLAAWIYSNAGFSCLTPRLLIQHRQWPQRQALLDALDQALQTIPQRPAYYPGARVRQAAFVASHPEARLYAGIPGPDAGNAGASSANAATAGGEMLPWTLIVDAPAANPDDICFKTEPFCAVLSETALDAAGPAEFLAQATAFANDHVWGTLSAALLLPDGAAPDGQVRAALDRTLAELRYGTICINLFTGLAYALMNTPWGSYPGQTAADIQSGVGFVNNPWMLRQPQKTIFRVPLQRIDPVTLHNKSAAAFLRRYAAFMAQPAPGQLPGLLWQALQH